ncbi:LacI family DNA-binding transcriptional regulator [Comamonas humi]
MTSIKDVARHAGVSVTTVSHTLNGTRAVQGDTRERVLAAVQALGYVPSAVARSLKTQATHTIGMLVPSSANPYFAELVHAVEDACFAAGYALLLCNTEDQPERQRSYLDVLAQKRVDGLIVASTSDDAAMSQTLARTRLPMVLIDRAIAGLACPCVQTDHALGAALGTRHLAAQGHRRIACIAGPVALQSSQQRVQGWQDALAQLGLPAAALEVGDFSVNSGYQAMQRLLQAPVAQRPSAVLACNDLMAMGALRAAHEAGLAIPRELAVLGYDGIELASYTHPALSTVAQPTAAMAQRALALLLQAMRPGHGESTPSAQPPQPELLAPTLVVRESSAAPFSESQP